jgi:tetratricopeptide (TPR) repeat protein
MSNQSNSELEELAVQSLERENPSEAVKYFRVCIEQSDSFSERSYFLRWIARTHEAEGRLEEARSTLEIARTIDPTPWTEMAIGHLASRRGDSNGVRKCLEAVRLRHRDILDSNSRASNALRQELNELEKLLATMEKN